MSEYAIALCHITTSADFRDVVLGKIISFAESFKPELIIFSAGFDGHESDPLASMQLKHEFRMDC